MEFQMELYTKSEHVIAKVYKFLSRFEMEKEQVKEQGIKWAKNFCYNI